MAIEKEVEAFVERIGKRVNDNPRASHSGRHRAAFIALRALIEGALASGYTMKTAWATLRDEKKLSMSYQTFRMHCRRAGLGQGVQAPRAQREPPPSGKVIPPQAAATTAGELPDRGFRHERVPRKKDIYG